MKRCEMHIENIFLKKKINYLSNKYWQNKYIFRVSIQNICPMFTYFILVGTHFSRKIKEKSIKSFSYQFQIFFELDIYSIVKAKFK